MKRSLIPLPLAFSITLAAAAAADVSWYDRFQLWSSCEPLSMLVVPLSTQEIGLEPQALQTAVSSRLRAARLLKIPNDLTEGPVLSVGIQLNPTAFAINVSLLKSVKDLASGETASTTTWETSSFGTHAGRPDFILNGVSQHMDQFIDDYLRVNAAACLP